MNICKRCHKREIDTNRSKRHCTICADKYVKYGKKQRDITDTLSIRKGLGVLAVSMNLCRACFFRPIDFSHSSYFCDRCFSSKRKGNIKYKQSHRKQAADKTAEWRKENPERAKASTKLWNETHKDKIKIHHKNRKARVRNAEGYFTELEWNQLVEKYNHKCLWCGTQDKELTADHIIPITKGGTNYIDNIQPLCGSCNSKKHTKTIDFRPFGSAILEWT